MLALRSNARITEANPNFFICANDAVGWNFGSILRP
jgi:hypothetical protein